jgi:hypothetical protein
MQSGALYRNARRENGPEIGDAQKGNKSARSKVSNFTPPLETPLMLDWTDSKASKIIEGVEPSEDDTEAIATWQHLIDTGLCWQLQGWYVRTAQNLIELGICSPARCGKRSSRLLA